MPSLVSLVGIFIAWLIATELGVIFSTLGWLVEPGKWRRVLDVITALTFFYLVEVISRGSFPYVPDWVWAALFIFLLGAVFYFSGKELFRKKPELFKIRKLELFNSLLSPLSVFVSIIKGKKILLEDSVLETGFMFLFLSSGAALTFIIAAGVSTGVFETMEGILLYGFFQIGGAGAWTQAALMGNIIDTRHRIARESKDLDRIEVVDRELTGQETIALFGLGTLLINLSFGSLGFFLGSVIINVDLLFHLATVILVMFGLSYVYRGLKEEETNLITLLICSIFIILPLAFYISLPSETEILYRFAIICLCFVMPYLRDGWNMLLLRLGRKHKEVMLDPYLESLLGTERLKEIVNCIKSKFGQAVDIYRTEKIHIAVRRGEEIIDAFIFYLGQLGPKNLEECYRASRFYVTPKILVNNKEAAEEAEEILSRKFVSRTNYVIITLKSFRDEYLISN